MARQRWGTFSVADHLRPRAFVVETMLYDRLVIPYPPDSWERDRWEQAGWNPDHLDKCLALLKDAGILSGVPWTENLQWIFRNYYQLAHRVSLPSYDYQDDPNTSPMILAQGVSFDIGNLRSAWDPMYVSRMILAQNENLPKADYGVAEVLAVAAYPSTERFVQDFGPEEALVYDEIAFLSRDRRARVEKLGWLLGKEFLIPDDERRSDLELLKEAIELAKTPEFRIYRDKLYAWQDNVVQNNILDEKALEEIRDSQDKYEALIKSTRQQTYKKFVYTVIIPGMLTAAAIPMGGPIILVPALLTLAGVFVNVFNFVKFERQPELGSNQYDAAAMFYAAQKHFGWE